MNFETFRARYFRIAEKLLSIVGIGTAPVSMQDKMKRVLCSIVLLTEFITVGANLIELRRNFNQLVEMIPPFLFLCMLLFRYWSGCINHDNVNVLLAYIRCDFNALREENEFRILTKCYNNGRFFGSTLMVCIYLACAMMPLSIFSPVILDFVLPLNESRPKVLPFDIVYYIDIEKYFIPITIHFQAAILIGCTGLIASEWLNILFVMHSSAMFQIVSYQVKHILERITLTDMKNQENSVRMINQLLAKTVRLHVHAYEFAEFILKSFGGIYCLLLILAVINLSTNLYFLTNSILTHAQIDQILCAFFGLIAVMCHYFVASYLTQEIINSSTNIYFDSYDSRWYNAPTSTRRIIMLMMRRAEKACTFLIGGVYSASVASFSAVCRMSFSYFTFLYSAHT